MISPEFHNSVYSNVIETRLALPDLYSPFVVQVNLFQKHLFLNHSWIQYKKNTSWEHVVYKHCFEDQNKNKKTMFVHNMFWSCIFLVLKSGINEQSVVILWVNWLENECFWHRFTCKNIENINHSDKETTLSFFMKKFYAILQLILLIKATFTSTYLSHFF